MCENGTPLHFHSIVHILQIPTMTVKPFAAGSCNWLIAWELWVGGEGHCANQTQAALTVNSTLLVTEHSIAIWLCTLHHIYEWSWWPHFKHTHTHHSMSWSGLAWHNNFFDIALSWGGVVLQCLCNCIKCIYHCGVVPPRSGWHKWYHARRTAGLTWC